MAYRGWNVQSGIDPGPPPPAPGYYQATTYPQNYGWASFQGSTAPYGWVHHPQQWQWPNTNQANDGSIPGMLFRNDFGGIGMPSGYSYIFPREHCRFHVFKTSTAPWETRINIQDPRTYEKCIVPTNVSVQELMQQLGCNNKDPKKNKLYEVTQATDGTWRKGLTMSGDDKDRMKTKITDWGWDKTRTGEPNERSVVWLWLTKD